MYYYDVVISLGFSDPRYLLYGSFTNARRLTNHVIIPVPIIGESPLIQTIACLTTHFRIGRSNSDSWKFDNNTIVLVSLVLLVTFSATLLRSTYQIETWAQKRTQKHQLLDFNILFSFSATSRSRILQQKSLHQQTIQLLSGFTCAKTSPTIVTNWFVNSVGPSRMISKAYVPPRRVLSHRTPNRLRLAVMSSICPRMRSNLSAPRSTSPWA